MSHLENRSVLIVLIILALASCGGYYMMQEQSRSKQRNYGHYPDSIGVGLKLFRYDQTGFLEQIISATRSLHYPDTKTTDFEATNIQAFNHSNDPPWLISAPTATAFGSGETVQAHGHVHMQQAAYPGHPATQLDTSDVTIYTNKKYMITNAPITGVQPGLQIYAVGGKYDYDKQILSLFNQVKVNYQPSERKKT